MPGDIIGWVVLAVLAAFLCGWVFRDEHRHAQQTILKRRRDEAAREEHRQHAKWGNEPYDWNRLGL